MTRFFAMAAAAAVLFSGSAQASPLCGPHEIFIMELTKGNDPPRHSSGCVNGGDVIDFASEVEIFVNSDDSFVVISTDRDGRTCFLFKGMEFKIDAPAKIGSLQ